MQKCDNPPPLSPRSKRLLHLSLVRSGRTVWLDVLNPSSQRLSEDNSRFLNLSFRYLMRELV